MFLVKPRLDGNLTDTLPLSFLARVTVTSMQSQAAFAFICCTYRVLLVGFSFHFQVHTDRISFLTLCHEGPNSTVQLLASSPLDGHGAAEKKTVISSGLREVLCPNMRCWIGRQHFLLL